MIRRKGENFSNLAERAPGARAQAARAFVPKQGSVLERNSGQVRLQRQPLDARAMEIHEFDQATFAAAHAQSGAGQPGLAFGSDFGESDLAGERVLSLHFSRPRWPVRC